MKETISNFTDKFISLDKANSLPILEALPSYGKVTVIIIHGGCVFEYKGSFPKGAIAHGFYNLDSQGEGFEGHINIEKIENIELATKLHRGRPSYSINFKNAQETIFKVFLGRDENGEIFSDQLEKFQQLEKG